MIIKLQILLVPNVDSAATDRVKTWLAHNGIRVTNVGARSLSTEVEIRSFRLIFGEPPKSTGGFVAPHDAERLLSIPPELRDVISLITFVPRHDIHSGG